MLALDLTASPAPRSELRDEDFQLYFARSTGTRPRTAHVRLIHRPDCREVDLCIWLDPPHTGAIGSITASLYIGPGEALRCWATRSELVAKAIRGLR